MNIHTIHKRILGRLALVWIIVSVITGSIVYFAGQKRLESYVVSLAEVESSLYLDRYKSFHAEPTKERQILLTGKVRDLVQNSAFMVVEIYNRDGVEVAKGEKAEGVKLYAELPKHDRNFTNQVGHDHFALYIDNSLYMRIFVPIKEQNDRIIGFFEGIYKVDQETLKRLQGAVILTLGMVVLAIFVTSLALYPVIISLNRGLVRYSLDLTRSNLGTLEALGSAIAKRDSDTNSHNYRVTLYALRLAELLGRSHAEMQRLVKGAFLHDLGKIAIADSILLKRGKLTEEEFQVMKTHVRHGIEIIQGYAWLRDAEDVVRCHHEKYDGSGYLEGLAGEEIPVNARIFAIVDVFDALTSQRPYKDAWPLEKAMAVIQADSGTHFDPRFASVFCQHAPVLYREIFCDNEQELQHRLSHYMNTLFPGLEQG